MGENLLRFTAKKYGCQALATVAGHEDAVAVLLLTCFDQRFSWREGFDGNGFHGHTFLVEDGACIREALFGHGTHSFVIVVDRFGTVFGKGGVAVWFDYGDQNNGGTQRLGKTGSAAHGLNRKGLPTMANGRA